MFLAAVFALLAFSVGADAQTHYSFSPPVGSGSGSPYVIQGEGRITGVRLWEIYYGRIYGIQLRYEYAWSSIAGYTYGSPLEFDLFEGERIVQISGKTSSYLNSVKFVTSRGRFIAAGQPSGHSFNMYPDHPDSGLVMISGHHSGGIRALAAHWATSNPFTNSTNW